MGIFFRRGDRGLRVLVLQQDRVGWEFLPTASEWPERALYLFLPRFAFLRRPILVLTFLLSIAGLFFLPFLLPFLIRFLPSVWLILPMPLLFPLLGLGVWIALSPRLVGLGARRGGEATIYPITPEDIKQEGKNAELFSPSLLWQLSQTDPWRDAMLMVNQDKLAKLSLGLMVALLIGLGVLMYLTFSAMQQGG